jgi:RNA polymerase sigma factor (TIGR02999 family)
MQSSESTQLLRDWRKGDDVARDALFDRVYEELRLISASLLRGEGNASLSTGDLVSEASMRLLKLEEIDWQDKAHFMAMAARMMRRVLIDHARAKGRNKREHFNVTLATGMGPSGKDVLDLLNVEQALTRLKVLDEERASIIELRYYGGLSFEDTAEALGMSVSTAKRKWRSARAWLLMTIQSQIELD